MNPGPSLVLMNVAALRPHSLRSLVTSPHRGLVEGATLLSLYGVYELIRGGGHSTLGLARQHTDAIVSLERHLHVFGERALQHASHAVPALPSVLGVAYMALHFGVTIGFLFWMYRKHRDRFPLIRNTMVVGTAIALAIYVLYPAAPPRLAGLGFVDTVTNGAHLNLSSNLLGSVYNPVAAVPSLHFGYALIVGVAVAAYAGRRSLRIAGALYPLVMLVVIVATGNHFFFDAAAGGIVVAVGYLVARAFEARRSEAGDHETHAVALPGERIPEAKRGERHPHQLPGGEDENRAGGERPHPAAVEEPERIEEERHHEYDGVESRRIGGQRSQPRVGEVGESEEPGDLFRGEVTSCKPEDREGAERERCDVDEENRQRCWRNQPERSKQREDRIDVNAEAAHLGAPHVRDLERPAVRRAPDGLNHVPEVEASHSEVDVVAPRDGKDRGCPTHHRSPHNQRPAVREAPVGDARDGRRPTVECYSGRRRHSWRLPASPTAIDKAVDIEGVIVANRVMMVTRSEEERRPLV